MLYHFSFCNTLAQMFSLKYIINNNKTVQKEASHSEQFFNDFKFIESHFACEKDIFSYSRTDTLEMTLMRETPLSLKCNSNFILLLSKWNSCQLICQQVVLMMHCFSTSHATQILLLNVDP